MSFSEDPMDMGPNIQIVEVDVFKGAARILKEARQMYPLIAGQDHEWEQKLKYTMDVVNNCLYQHWQMQAIRIALHKSIAKDNLELEEPDEPLKH